MNKLSLLLALSFILLIVAQPPPNNQGGNGEEDNKEKPPAGGEEGAESLMRNKKKIDCTVSFYKDGKVAYEEELDNDDDTAYRGKLSSKYDNKIDEIYWDGDRCYCWVVVYQGKNFKDLNLGFWTYSDSGSYDLSYYNTYDFKDDQWERWDQVVSSYAIYCY